MADPTRFGKSEREYTGVPRRGLSNNQRFGRSERAYTGVTDRTGGKYDRFGPSEKRYSEARYTPSGQGTSWGFTGDSSRKIPRYDAGSRPPRGLASLISRQGPIGQDPRSSTYANDWGFAFGSPDDLRGYRASVANVAAANAAKEQQRIAEETAGEFLPEPTIPYQYRGRYETPGEIGKGYGMMGEEYGYPGIEEWLKGFRPKAQGEEWLKGLTKAQGEYRQGPSFSDEATGKFHGSPKAGYDDFFDPGLGVPLGDTGYYHEPHFEMGTGIVYDSPYGGKRYSDLNRMIQGDPLEIPRPVQQYPFRNLVGTTRLPDGSLNPFYSRGGIASLRR